MAHIGVKVWAFVKKKYLLLLQRSKGAAILNDE